MSTYGHPSFLSPPPPPPPLLSSSTAHSSLLASSDGGGSSTSLRTQHSFSSKVDEGYSGDETQTPSSAYEDSGMRDRMSDVKIPAWMTGLSVELRAEYAYKLIRTLPTSHIASLVDRLVPFLHLDFIQILPSELSLQILSYLPPKSLLDASLTSRTWRKFALEPRLWRDLYRAQGWQADEDEVRKFEMEMQARAERDMRQQVDSKRKAEENRDDERKSKEARHSNSTSTSTTTNTNTNTNTISTSSSSSNPNSIATGGSQEWAHDVVEPGGSDSLDASYGSAVRAAALPSSTLSDDDEMYPTPRHRPSAASQPFADPPLSIEPTLTTPGYGCPRLNWAFLFKNRRRLEDNWLHNRCVPFQIPHPNYPHEGHRECIYTIQYSSKWLCSGSRDKTIRVWDIKTRRSRGEPLVGHSGSVLCLQFDESPAEDVIISGSSDASVIVWRFSTGELLHAIPRAHDESVLNLRFSPKWLVTCSKDKLIKIWNRRVLETDDADYPWHSKLVFGPHGAAVNHPHHPCYQTAWTVPDPATASGFGLQNPFGAGARPPSPRPLPAKSPPPAQAAASDRSAGLQNSFGGPGPRPPARSTPRTLPAYTAVNSLPGHVAAVNAIQLHGDEIVSASGDRVIKLWNLRSGKCEKTFVGHQKGIACIQFDGKTIVSGSSDQTIRVFDRDTQAEIATLRGHGALVRTVQATRNRIVSGSYDESVRVWRRDEETGGWLPGAVLRQAQTPLGALGTPASTAQIHLDAYPQSLGHGAPAHAPGQVQMHQVHQVGGPGLVGAVITAQLLPNYHQHQHQQHQQHQQQQHHHHQQQQQQHHHHQHQQQQQQQQQHQQQQVQAAQQLQQYQQQQHSNAMLQQQAVAALTAAAAAAPPMTAAAAAAPPNNSSGAHRVFKLQFDARWIICCSQNTRIVGWDYAADDESIIEASRFFMSGP